MTRAAPFHLPALEGAVAAMARDGGRFEVFARTGERDESRWNLAGWEHRTSREAGVACRVSRNGAAGFAAAAGAAAAAGREAAEAAVRCLGTAPDPLPPVAALGSSPVQDVPHATLQSPAVGEFAAALHRHLARAPGGLELVELRALAGRSVSVIHTGDGFSARSDSQGAIVEIVMRCSAGFRVLHRAAPVLGGWLPEALVADGIELLATATTGGSAAPGLADVILGPDVAAAVLSAVVPSFAATRRQTRSGAPRVAPVWRLVDERCGGAGLTAAPFDGEGLPGRPLTLAADGVLGEAFATWAEARDLGVRAGGAVRASYRDEPRAGAANLVAHATRPESTPALLQRLERGMLALLPLGDVRFEPTTGRFALVCTALRISAGRPAGPIPNLELRGSVTRLLRGLEATGGDAQGFSLACPVTTPSLLIRGLEIG